MVQEKAINPLSGWFGHACPFAFKHFYEQAPGITRFLVGTTPVIALSALEVSILPTERLIKSMTCSTPYKPFNFPIFCFSLNVVQATFRQAFESVKFRV